MRILFIGQKQIITGLMAGLIAVFLLGAALNGERIARKVVGVKPGVKLAGVMVQGLLPNEVATVVKTLATRIEQSPRNASYFPETGEVIPEQAGRIVNVATNVKRVCLARPNTALKLMVTDIPAKVSSDYFKPVYSGNPNLPRVALAINVAWGEEYLPEMLNTLRDAKVKASFFLVGTWVKIFPEHVKTLAAAGHELANHGFYHGHPLQMNQDELRRLILDNEALIKSLTGKKPVSLFAPPYGELNEAVVGVAGNLGYHTIMWSVDSVDWKRPAPELIIERVMSKIKPGGIILLHPTVVTKEALPTLIKLLRQRGLEPGTVSSVLN